MATITNPSSSTISMTYEGVTYSCAGNNGTLSNVPTSAAAFWKDNTHQFIIVTSDSTDIGGETPADPTQDSVVAAEIVSDDVSEDPTS